MTCKLVALLAIACFVQATYSADANVEAISPEVKKELLQATIEVAQIKKKSGIEVTSVRIQLEKRINVVLHPIEKQLRELKAEVKAADKKSKISKIDISECVKAENKGVKDLNKDAVRKCRQIKELHEAGQKLGQLGDILRVLRHAAQNCAAKGDACVKEAIADAKKRAPVLQKEISELAKKVKPEDQDKCIQDGGAELKKEVDAVQSNWRECLKKHEKPTEN